MHNIQSLAGGTGWPYRRIRATGRHLESRGLSLDARVGGQEAI